MNHKKYIYPKLSDCDWGMLRFGGAGLANNMFIAARAHMLSRKYDLPMLRPTWEKFSPGPFLRREKDKRHYCGLFRNEASCGLRKLYLLKRLPHFPENTHPGEIDGAGIIDVDGLKDYFEPLLSSIDSIREYFLASISPAAIRAVPPFRQGTVGLHIRLGDYNAKWRIGTEWYCGIVRALQHHSSFPLDFQLFSDGSDEELAPLLAIPGVRRVFYGNALADIMAISRCSLVVASDSTFSGWGIFLGQCPAIFNRCHFGRVSPDPDAVVITGDETELPGSFLDLLRSRELL